ncbi:MAG TPA: pilus assembly protein PilP [Myxococcota bacterium]|jgi:type IV pilus assembly protein PilP
MKKTARSAVLASGLALALAGCSEQGPTANATDFEKARAEAVAKAPTVATAAPAAKPGAPAEDKGGVRTNYGVASADYRYDPAGKRDPFRSFVKDKLNDDKLDLTSPLEQFELGQLTISGVVWQADRRRALVLDPSGQAYVVKNGDRIGKNDGVVTEINDSSMLVLESYVDFHGDKTEKEIEMRIRQSTGG